MTKHRFLVLLLVPVILLSSCNINSVDYLKEEAYDFDSVELFNQGAHICKTGDTVHLEIKITGNKNSYTYQWYKCSSLDKENSEKIEGAVDYFLDIAPVEEEKKFYYFYCDVTKNIPFEITRSSQVFSVIDTGLPTVYINTPSVIKDTSNWVKNCTLTIDEDAYSEVSVKGRGNSSWGMPKKSYTIKLDSKTDFLGMGEDKKGSV